MKKIILISLLFTGLLPLKAQYVIGIGTNVGTAAASIKTKDFLNQNDLIYEVSLKAFTQADRGYDIIGSSGKDYMNFTLLSEVHRPVFYPINWYIGIGGNIGVWKDNHWADEAKHDNTFAGLDGSFGFQCTLFPISFNVGVRPVYLLYGGDQFYLVKQIGLRICFR